MMQSCVCNYFLNPCLSTVKTYNNLGKTKFKKYIKRFKMLNRKMNSFIYDIVVVIDKVLIILVRAFQICLKTVIFLLYKVFYKIFLLEYMVFRFKCNFKLILFINIGCE